MSLRALCVFEGRDKMSDPLVPPRTMSGPKRLSFCSLCCLIHLQTLHFCNRLSFPSIVLKLMGVRRLFLLSLGRGSCYCNKSPSCEPIAHAISKLLSLTCMSCSVWQCFAAHHREFSVNLFLKFNSPLGDVSRRLTAINRQLTGK